MERKGRYCKEGRINELSLCYSLPPGVPAAGSHLGAPQHCCPYWRAPGSCSALQQEGLGPAEISSWLWGAGGNGFSCSWKLNFICEQHFLGWQFVSLDPLQTLERVGFIPREKVHGEQENNLTWDISQGECAMLGH